MTHGITDKSAMINRRDLLRTGTLGIGSLALSHLLTNESQASGLHHPPRAKNVIFLHMVGGPSQMDTFDPKPELDKWDGRSLPPELTKGQKIRVHHSRSKSYQVAVQVRATRGLWDGHVGAVSSVGYCC